MTTQVLLSPQVQESLLYDLVSVASPSHEEADAVHILVNWMATHGFHETYVDEAGNAVGIIGHGPREVVLLGHIDTFGGTLPVHLDDRTLYGRGTVDAKGALSVFAAASAQAAIAGDLRVVVIGAVEEEAASSKGARFAATQFQPDLCIIGEPSRWDRITLGYKGRLLLRWRWDGALAHSASQVSSPPEHAIAYWDRVTTYVNAFNDGRNSLFGRLDATLQSVNSGQDGAYGWAEMVVGFRLPPDVDPHQLAADLQPEQAQYEPYGHEAAFIAEQDSPLSRAMRGAIRAHGGKPRFVHKTGTSDMNIVGPLWNCPIIAYGPGDSALDHTPNEHLDLDEYLTAINVLKDALARL